MLIYKKVKPKNKPLSGHDVPWKARIRYSQLSDVLKQALAHPLGHVFLSGCDYGSAGLDDVIDQMHHGYAVGSCISFCLNGVTYTALENEDDGYRSSMAELIARPGNYCKNKFSPTPLAANLEINGDHPLHGQRVNAKDFGEMDEQPHLDWSVTVVNLWDPIIGKKQEKEAHRNPVFSVGTDNSDDYYPSFVAHFNAELFHQAFMKHEKAILEKVATVTGGSTVKPKARRL